MKKTIFMGGAHRGGRAITEAALRTLPAKTFNEVVIADPKEGRALQLARNWSDRGIRSEGVKAPCETAIESTEADSIVLAIDTISPMADILEARPVPTQWQLLARGLGFNGPVVGISGTVTDGDSQSRSSSTKLIKELGSFIEPQTSGNIMENPLNADFLHVMRKKLSEHSAKRLTVLDREPQDFEGGPLNLLWGSKTYPLAIQDKPVRERWSETKERIMDAELPGILRNSSHFAVALVGQKNVDFFVVETARGKRSIRFHMPLMHTLPASTATRGSSLAAIGAALGLGLAIAPMLAAAAVTD